METYSTYDAKARLSEILRKVRSGQTIVISSRGEPVAEVRPIRRSRSGLEARLEELGARGALVRSAEAPQGPLEPVARRPGALARFLEDRDR